MFYGVVKLVFSRYYLSMKADDIYDYVERLSELFRIDTRQAGVGHGLQPVQLEVLHYLSICNRFSDTPMAVTEYLGQTKGTVSQTIKVLENKGLVSKIVDQEDKRVTHLALSTQGKRLINQLVPTTMVVNACKALPEKTQSQIASSLNQLLSALLESNDLKTFGACHSCRYNSQSGEEGYYCNLAQQPLTLDDVKMICREHES